MLKVLEYMTIQNLWKKGKNKSEISRITGHDWKTVAKVIKNYKEGKTMPEKKPHPKFLDSYKEEIIKWLEEGLTGVRIHEELILLGKKISYSAVKKYIAYIKKKTKIFIRKHTKPAEEADSNEFLTLFGKDTSEFTKLQECNIESLLKDSLKLINNKNDSFTLTLTKIVEAFFKKNKKDQDRIIKELWDRKAEELLKRWNLVLSFFAVAQLVLNNNLQAAAQMALEMHLDDSDKRKEGIISFIKKSEAVSNGIFSNLISVFSLKKS